MRSNARKFESLKKDLEAPIYVRNVMDEPWILELVRRTDFRGPWDQRNRVGLRTLKVEPNEVVNLREVLTDDCLEHNLQIPWYINTDRVIVLNDGYWYFDEEDYAALEEEVRNPPPKHTSRWYMIQSQRRRNERPDPR